MAEEPLSWDKKTRADFEKILEQIPAMIRGIAEARVSKKAQTIVREDSRTVVEQKDMVEAFFAETPPDFMGPMKNSMDELGVDYKRYGHQ